VSAPRTWLQRLLGRSDTAPAPTDDDLFDEDTQRRLEYLAVVSRRLFAGRLRAERRTKKSGTGIEFADHRDYAAGDDLRNLDWHVYARTDRLLVKLFEEEEDLAIYVIVDCSASMSFGGGRKFVHARRLAAALAYVGLANLDRVALLGWSGGAAKRMPPARGKGRIFKVFEFLRSLRADGETDLAAAARTFAAENKRRGVAILVSDLYDPAGFERGLNAIRYQKFEPMVVHVVDPAEVDLAAHGDLVLEDVETGAEREVTLTPELVARYHAQHALWRKEIEAFCASRQVPYAAAEITGAFEDQVLDLFRRMGGRR